MATSPYASQRRDVFISHASEDKDLARPLTDELIRRGLSVWFDEHELVLGDSLQEVINEGLAGSRIGVVILSHDFFAKQWPQLELDGLHARLAAGEKNVIVPVWHGLTADDVRRYSPMLAGRLAGNSELGIDRLADEIERVLQRAVLPSPPRRRRRRLARSSEASAGLSSSASAPAPTQGSAPAQRTASKQQQQSLAPTTTTEARPEPQPASGAPTPITELDPEIVPEERAEVLAERVVASIKAHSDECLMTVVAGGRLVIELVKRADGAVTIRSNRLSPQQRVLSAKANTLLAELTTSVLKQLSAPQLAAVEIHGSPETLSELPARMRASKEQLKLAENLVAALRQGADHRQIALQEEQGMMQLTRTDDTVRVSVAGSFESRGVLSIPLGDPDLEEGVLQALTDISTRRGFGNGRFSDHFPLPGAPNFAKLRILTERLMAADARFTLWQRHPVERPVLAARRSREGALVLECPGTTPSVQQFQVGRMVAFVEMLENTVTGLVELHGEPLEVRASWLITEPLS